MTTWNSRPASLSRDRRNHSLQHFLSRVQHLLLQPNLLKGCVSQVTGPPHEIEILVTDSCLHSSRTGLSALVAILTRTYPGRSGLMVATVSRTGTGPDQPRCAVIGTWVIHGHAPRYRRDTAPLRNGPIKLEALRVKDFRSNGNLNSSYNEYISRGPRFNKITPSQATPPLSELRKS